MRQYQVPQFITIEDKIIGPLTIRQFIYLAVAGGIVVISFYILTFAFFLIFSLPVALAAVAFAFVKINGIPFGTMLANAANYFMRPNLYIWKQLPREKKTAGDTPPAAALPVSKIPTITESKLQDLAWSLDIKDKLD